HDEVEAAQVLDHVTRDLAADKVREGLLDALSRERAFQQLKILGLVSPHINIRGIAFVAGARMRDVADDPARVSSRGVHATMTCKVGLTRSRSSKPTSSSRRARSSHDSRRRPPARSTTAIPLPTAGARRLLSCVSAAPRAAARPARRRRARPLSRTAN